MSDMRKAAQQALDALENHTAIKHPQQRAYRDDAIEALRAALEKERFCDNHCTWRDHADGCANADAAEPVGYFSINAYGLWEENENGYGNPLYTAPPQRPLLTDEEIDKATTEARDALLDHIYEYGTTAEGILERVRKLSRAIERKVRGEE